MFHYYWIWTKHYLYQLYSSGLNVNALRLRFKNLLLLYSWRIYVLQYPQFNNEAYLLFYHKKV